MLLLHLFLPLTLFIVFIEPAVHSAAPPDRLDTSSVLPIVAWGGPPPDQTTVERYRELADCGFTHNLSGFGSADAVAKALDVADATSIKLLLNCPELSTDPEGTAKRFKTHRALGGYYLRDEPSATDFAGLATWTRRVQSQDTLHPCYINLFPNYATTGQLGTPTYREHVDRFVREVPVPLISFDHYPVVGQSVRGEWYENLEIISAAARKVNKPFWAFSLAVAHGPYPIPTLAHLRAQAYSNLAYGAQGLQSFTYWTLKSDTWDFHDGPILPDGRRSVVYDRVRQVNREVQALRGVFFGSTVESVGHTGQTIPNGTRAYQPAAPVKSLKIEGQGAVVSILSKGERKFLVVVNRDINQPMRLAADFEPIVSVARVAKDGALHDLEASRYAGAIEPGDVAIFVWGGR